MEPTDRNVLTTVADSNDPETTPVALRADFGREWTHVDRESLNISRVHSFSRKMLDAEHFEELMGSCWITSIFSLNEFHLTTCS
jgi:hypothetical protein